MSDRGADIARLRRSLAANPDDAIAWHNLAAAEGDLGRAAQSEEAARRAIALGIRAPETRLVLARALQSLGRLDEAEQMFLAAIEARPAYGEAHRDLAQLRWMRTGDVAAALERLEQSLRVAADPALHLVKSIVLEFAGDTEAALAAAETGLAGVPGDPALLRQAAHLCAGTHRAERSVELASRALSAAPAEPELNITLCESLLAAGRVAEAEALAARLCSAHPLDQHALALRATAWRLLGDARYAELHDYQALVGRERLEAPQGWGRLQDLLDAVQADLEELHCYRAHPLQQSVRGGSQLPLNDREMARPAIRALFDSIQASVRRYLTGLGRGPGPLRSRNTGRAAITGAWSVRLDSGGSHTDHVHPRGWLSSACHIAVPGDLGRVVQPDRQGWLRLGRPGIATLPPLEADHFVEPQEGTLVLFPAYMWHGVEPFRGQEPRLSVAFDAIPA